MAPGLPCGSGGETCWENLEPGEGASIGNLAMKKVIAIIWKILDLINGNI